MAWLTIAVKDFRTIVFSPIFFVMCGLASCLWSFTYLRQIIEFAARSMGGGMMGMGGPQNIHFGVFVSHVWLVNLLFIFIAPAITMRLLADEKKARTFDLLLTSPITSVDIAIGKFLAGFWAAGILVLISMLYPLGTAFFADFSFGPLLSSYLGLLLTVALYIAVGLFASSLTEAPIAAVFFGAVINLSLWFISQGAQSSDNPTLSAILEHVSLGSQFSTFIRGTLQSGASIFFISCIGLFVFLTQRVVESARWR